MTELIFTFDMISEKKIDKDIELFAPIDGYNISSFWYKETPQNAKIINEDNKDCQIVVDDCDINIEKKRGTFAFIAPGLKKGTNTFKLTIKRKIEE